MLLAAAVISTPAFSCGEITPNKQVSKIVHRLAYNKSFPRESDIYSIIRIESGFNQDAMPPISYEAVDKKGAHVKGLINASSPEEAQIKLKKQHLRHVKLKDRETSVGLMQVQNGPKDLRENIAMGISKLREFYMLTGSEEGAVKSYNVGPANYLKGKLTVSAEAYYDKFLLQKKVYVPYAKTGKVGNLGKTLGCGKENGIPLEIQARLAN